MPSIYSLEHERVQVVPSIGYGSELSKTGSMRRPRPRNCQTPSGEVGKPARLFGSPEIMGAAATGRGNNTPLFRFIHTRKDFLLSSPFSLAAFCTPQCISLPQQQRGPEKLPKKSASVVGGSAMQCAALIKPCDISSGCLPKFHLLFPCFHKDMIQNF